MDNTSGITTDAFHEAHVGAKGCFKGGIAALLKAAAEARNFKQILGNEFYDFARTRLGLSPALADFLLRVAGMGLDPTKFTPAVEVKLQKLLEVLGMVVETYAATSSTTGRVMRDVAADAATAPAENTITSDGAAGSAIPDKLSGIGGSTNQDAAPIHPGTAPLDGKCVVADNPQAHRPEFTPEQRRFIAGRSVTLLLQVNRGELSVDEAMRQAEGMPIRKGKISVVAPGK